MSIWPVTADGSAAVCPKYRDHFEAAAQKYGLDWHLVAAQAYQESHWDPKAKSFTGVRGMMMLTLETAKTLGLKDRLAAEDSIVAGYPLLGAPASSDW